MQGICNLQFEFNNTYDSTLSISGIHFKLERFSHNTFQKPWERKGKDMKDWVSLSDLISLESYGSMDSSGSIVITKNQTLENSRAFNDFKSLLTKLKEMPPHYQFFFDIVEYTDEKKKPIKERR